MKKIAIIIIIFFALFSGGAIYAFSNDSPILDRFLSSEMQELRRGMRQTKELQKMRKLFPDQLGEYALYGTGSPEKIRIENQCDELESHPDTAGSGLTGESCQKSIIGEYRQVAGNKSVTIILTQITKGLEVFKTYMQRFGQTDELGNYNIIRLEKHEISWYPIKDFDAIMTQERTIRTLTDGGENYNYDSLADGNNPATQYFLSKYPPLKAD